MCSLFCNPGKSTSNFDLILPKIQFLNTQASVVYTPLMLLVHKRYHDKQDEIPRDPLRHFSALKKCKNDSIALCTRHCDCAERLNSRDGLHLFKTSFLIRSCLNCTSFLDRTRGFVCVVYLLSRLAKIVSSRPN